MSENPFISPSIVHQWIGEKLDVGTVEQKLKAEGFTDEIVSAYIREYTRQKIRQRQSTGFIITGVGAFLGFIGCVLTLTNPIPELFNLILYGLTSVSILIIFVGLYLVFE